MLVIYTRRVYIINIKQALIIVLIAAVLLVLFELVLFGINTHSDADMTLIAIGNGTTVSVPVSNLSDIENSENSVLHYTDPQYNVNITCWNSEEQQAIGKESDIQNEISQLKGSEEPTDEEGVMVYHNKDTDTYCAETSSNDTHDNLVISCKDKNLLVKIYATVKFGVSDFSKISNSTNITNVKVVNDTLNSTRYVVDEYGTYDTVNGTYIDGSYAGMSKSQVEQYYYNDYYYYDDASSYYGYYDQYGNYYDSYGYYDQYGNYYDYSYQYYDGSGYYQ